MFINHLEGEKRKLRRKLEKPRELLPVFEAETIHEWRKVLSFSTVVADGNRPMSRPDEQPAMSRSLMGPVFNRDPVLERTCIPAQALETETTSSSITGLYRPSRAAPVHLER